MEDQENGELAGDGSDEHYFEDRLVLWLTAPMWPLHQLPIWARLAFAIWNAIGGLSIWHHWVDGRPTWVVVALVGPVIYVTLFSALPMILYSCLFLLLMPWHAPAPPGTPVRSIIRQRVRRLKSAKAQRRDRRLEAGGWVKDGDCLVQVDSDGVRRHTIREFFWIEPVKTPARVRWTFRGRPDLRRKSGE